MDQQEVLTFTYPNPVFHHVRFTNKILLIEVVVFVLGENLYNGPTDRVEVRDSLYEYIKSFLDPLDLQLIDFILDEVSKHVEEISSDHTYLSLLQTDEIYLKYDYSIGPKFSKLRIYPTGTSTDY